VTVSDVFDGGHDVRLWDISEWINSKPVSLSGLRGKVVVIDKHGIIRMQHFGSFDPDYGEKLIRTLLDEQFEPKKASLIR
jgi:hypothetical protein